MPRLLLTHALATFLISSGLGVAWFLAALIARKAFGAGDWQTFFMTVVLPVMAVASLLWSEWLRSAPLRRYLWRWWAVACLPLAMIAFAGDFWGLLACHALAAFGQAGWSPALSLILKRSYRDQIHGRAFGFLSIAQVGAIMASTYFGGRWLDANPEAYRIFIPVIVVLQAVGVWLLNSTLPDEPGAGADAVPTTTPIGAMGVPAQEAATDRRAPAKRMSPIAGMVAVLREDRLFTRYEAAFMTYGAGYMICEAMFPLYVTDALNLNYTQVATWAVMLRGGTQLVVSAPAGWVMDALGAARTSALSFAVLALYPLVLIFTGSTLGLGIGSAIFGFGLAGVLQGWLLGPVTLAPSPDRAPHYVAIHSALVGVRGVLFQALGIIVYLATGSFAASFALASLAFLLGAWQMMLLAKPIRERRLAREAANAAAAEARTESKPELVVCSEGE
ncbi:MAG: hypothetical protein KDA32_10075 [Phycisphaerales bacterium]|nr:hypothetical protein [Phycisphaerales bacterium]